jgi:hypothetical protein
MSDIVERLRAAENAMRWDGIGEAIAEIDRLRELLARCEPHVHGNVAEWRLFLSPEYSESAQQAAARRIADGETVLREIAEALGDVPDA